MKFVDFHINPEILKAIIKESFIEPTIIQQRCIPKIMEGHDVVAQSLTGSGKTAAFGIPILEKIQSGKGIQSLILTPTRELTDQVKQTIGRFGAFLKIHITAVFGGVGMQPQIDSLKRTDIVVATPGRLLDHIRHNTINLKHVKYLVLDEADKMFEMGFIEDVEEIIRQLPKERQTLLFSATIPKEIHYLIKKHLKNPIHIQEQLLVSKHLLKQIYYEVKPHKKFSLLVHLLKHKTPGLAIVFCITRRDVDVLTRNLKMQKIKTMAVHGGLTQSKRSHAVSSLKSEDIQVLVATDVAARGLDIGNISHIYNYTSPKTAKEYIHRIGRTARAGKYGEAVTLISTKDYDNFRNVLSDRDIHIEPNNLPEFEEVPFIRPMHENRRHFSREYSPHQRESSHRKYKPRFHYKR